MLWVLVGDLQHGGAGLDEDLTPSEGVLSLAKSASRMELSASDRLLMVSLREAMFVSRVACWNAPKRPRSPVTLLIDSSTTLAALVGSVSRSLPPPDLSS